MALRFEYKMKVRDYECDMQGVVNNANYLHYFEATRHELMDHCGLKLETLTKQNVIPLLRNANISFKNSLHGMDEFLSTITIEREGLRYYFLQEITRLSDNKVCAKAVIEVVCLIDGKISEPDLFDKAFTDYIVWRNK